MTGTAAYIVCVIATGCGKIRWPRSHRVRSRVFYCKESRQGRETSPFVANIRPGSTRKRKTEPASADLRPDPGPCGMCGSWIPCILKRTKRKRLTEEKIVFTWRRGSRN